MSRRGYQGDKLLLDTSFILPILGFETSKEIMDVFPKLRNYIIYYNEISIIEALWRIVKVVGNKGDLKVVLDGIDAIRNTFEYAYIDSEAVENAVEMYRLGHRDMVDNILYSIALSEDLKLLTIDNELIKFIEEHEFPRENIVRPEDIINRRD